MSTGNQQIGDGRQVAPQQAVPQAVPQYHGLPSIERLSGRENWSSWRFAVETFLELEDLWEVVKPPPAAAGEAQPAVDAVKDRKARAKIILLLDPVNYVHVRDAKTAREVWAKLEEAFEDRGLTRRVGLLRKLITTSLSSCDSVDVYVNEIISTAHQLRGVGFELSEEWVGTLLLAGLPEEYKPMVMGLENSGVKITGDSIKTKLLQEVRSSSDRSAFVGKKAFPKKQKQSVTETRSAEQPKGPKCKNCHKFGHIAKNCNSKAGSAFCTVLSANTSKENDVWYFDSGASDHFTRSKRFLAEEQAASGVVLAADKAAMNIVASGLVKLAAKCCPEEPPITVNNVKYIPEMSNNLLSVSQIVRRGHEVRFCNEGVKVINPADVVIATGVHDVDKGLFRFEEDESAALSVARASENLNLWHRRMGHLSISSLKKLKAGLASGVSFEEAEIENCVVCAMGKQCRLPFSKKGHRAEEVLELVHSDICGPMEEKSLGGCRYYLSFTDDKTRRIFMYFLETKSEDEVLRAFNDFHSLAETQTGRKLKTIRTDNGKEYTNKSFQKRLSELGICHQTTVEYTPEQNGLAERINRTIVERARCMLFEAKLPKAYWAEAVAAATYLTNRSPTKGHKQTPEEAWSGRKPDLSHVRTFGSKVMAHIPKQKRKKWDPKAKESILVGYEEDTKAYRIYDPVTKQVSKSRDVTFISEPAYKGEQSVCEKEKQTFVKLDWVDTLVDMVPVTPQVVPAPRPDPDPVPGPSTRPVPCPAPRPVPVVQPDAIEEEEGQPILEESESESEAEESGVSDSSQYFSQTDDDGDGDVTITALPPRSTSNPPESPVLRRSGRERALPGKYKDFIVPTKCLPSHPVTDQPSTSRAIPNPQANLESVQHGLNTVKKTNDPRTVTEALRGSGAELWKGAMDEEYRALMENHTWDLVELPANKKAIGCKWIFKTKADEKGNVVRHKARIVAQGFTQKFGVDYDEVFAPVAKQVTFRTLLTVASRRRMVVKHVDVKTAYLNGQLEEDIYMKQPEGYTTGTERTVCRLRRSLYGLKQSARVWNHTVDAVFKKMGFVQCKSDQCLYVRRKNKTAAYILIYVDDMVIVTPSEEEFEAIFNTLERSFVVSNLGDIRHFLGMEVEKDAEGYKLNQQAYIKKLATRFNLQDAKPSQIPLDPSYLQQKEEDDRLPSNNQYLSLIGGLLYVAVHTRPDIAVSTSILAQKSSRPTKLDWNEAKRVLRYLRSTSDHKLRLGSTQDSLKMYVDADYAGDHRNRKSNSGHLIQFGGGVIAWGSRKQTCVSLSSTEAEFVALAEGCQELIWTKRLIEEIGEDVGTVTVLEDNQSCIKLLDSDRIDRRTKHIEVRYFFVRDLQQKGIIDIQYCPTGTMLADIFTKPLQRVRLEKLKKEIGVIPYSIKEEC